jgi:hypothetical protein
MNRLGYRYGSLVSEESAAATMGSEIRNWRTGRVEGFARVFNLVSIINIVRGVAHGRELATCTAVRAAGSHLEVCIFDAPIGRYADFAQREARLQHEIVEFTDTTGSIGRGVMCTAWSDDAYRSERIQDDADYHHQVTSQSPASKVAERCDPCKLTQKSGTPTGWAILHGSAVA